MNKQMFFSSLFSLFPQACPALETMQAQYGRILETVALEDIYMPLITAELRTEDHPQLLHALFRLLENACSDKNQELRDILSSTILEALGNDHFILQKAQNYMGTVTKQMQIEADRHLGRF